MTQEEILKQQLKELEEEGFDLFVIDEIFEKPVMVLVHGIPISFFFNTDLSVIN